MKTSDSIENIAKAMAAVQKEMQPAVKDANNPFFKSKYADLASVSAACRELMGANGVAIIQAPGQCAERQLSLTTRLIHESGEWIEETMTIPLNKFDPQAYGSALTYARRYSLAAFVGVVTDDDDGNAASRPNDNAVTNDAPKAPPELTDSDRQMLKAINESVVLDDLTKWSEQHGLAASESHNAKAIRAAYKSRLDAINTPKQKESL